MGGNGLHETAARSGKRTARGWAAPHQIIIILNYIWTHPCIASHSKHFYFAIHEDTKTASRPTAVEGDAVRTAMRGVIQRSSSYGPPFSNAR
ncbi:hypothetical protein GWL_11320 [Herbaspirillum sp. GW103]|nr:hypothetical protein GWL_11320 [Herbaspirillum sp. GW103]